MSELILYFEKTTEGIEGKVALWFENNNQILIFLPFRSDVLGQFMPLVGKDWTQSGVARLFSAIKVCIFLNYADLTYIQFNWSRIVKDKI